MLPGPEFQLILMLPEFHTYSLGAVVAKNIFVILFSRVASRASLQGASENKHILRPHCGPKNIPS